MTDHLQESATLDELDYLLVTALQREPRAEWRRIGGELGIDPSTAARRWARLTEAGLAWLSCYPAWLPPGALIAFIELDCAPGRVHEVALELADDESAARDVIERALIDTARPVELVGHRHEQAVRRHHERVPAARYGPHEVVEQPPEVRGLGAERVHCSSSSVAADGMSSPRLRR